jgi:hypothetical protein
MDILDTFKKQRLALLDARQHGRLTGVMAAISALSKLDNATVNSTEYQKIHDCLEKLFEDEKEKRDELRASCEQEIEDFKLLWEQVLIGAR